MQLVTCNVSILIDFILYFALILSLSGKKGQSFLVKLKFILVLGRRNIAIAHS